MYHIEQNYEWRESPVHSWCHGFVVLLDIFRLQMPTAAASCYARWYLPKEVIEHLLRYLVCSSTSTYYYILPTYLLLPYVPTALPTAYILTKYVSSR